MQPPFDFKLTPEVKKFYYWAIDEQASTMSGCAKYEPNYEAGACGQALHP